jgi:hypothetical protein
MGAQEETILKKEIKISKETILNMKRNLSQAVAGNMIYSPTHNTNLMAADQTKKAKTPNQKKRRTLSL